MGSRISQRSILPKSSRRAAPPHSLNGSRAGDTPRLDVANNDLPLLLDIHGVARLLSLSVRSVQRFHSAGHLPKPVEWFIGSTRWLRSDIEAWVAAGCPHQVDMV